jgi:hypothetical protein
LVLKAVSSAQWSPASTAQTLLSVLSQEAVPEVAN